MTRLDHILVHQRNTRMGDALFALFVALAAALSITSVSTAVQAAVSR